MPRWTFVDNNPCSGFLKSQSFSIIIDYDRFQMDYQPNEIYTKKIRYNRL